ncbi:MAG: alcohol dehydrogenase catalytic domain-containing protein, partial [Stackebrandtia sp.]
MKAIKQYTIGGPDTLRYEDVADPHPGPGSLRIAVAAAGVHTLDAAIRAGTAGEHPFANPGLPMTPGREVAGIVDEVGDGVSPDWLGQRVVTHLGIASGGYAELAVREAEAVHKITDKVSEAEAVAMIGTGRTALGVLDAVRFTADDIAIVTAAAGGIGSLLVQAAAEVGATIVGLAGGVVKTRRVAGLAGGVIAVDYTADGWPDRVREQLGDRSATVVLDGVGGKVGAAVFDLLGARGRMILFGYSSGEPTTLSTTDIIGRSLTVTAAIGPRLINR